MTWQEKCRQLNREKEAARLSMQQSEKELKEAEKNLQARAEIYDVERKKQHEEQAKRDVVIAKNKQEIAGILERSKAVKFSMNENFDCVLNESDWGSVDLLIYYIETGRADSVKEALQLLDRQKQTNQIAHAISDAQRSLTMTINTAMNRMGQALAKSFSIIGNQLSQISQNQKETISAIHVNTEATARLGASMAQALQDSASQQRQAISEQSAAMKLTNALIEKSNVNSERLLYDLRYNQNLWIK